MKFYILHVDMHFNAYYLGPQASPEKESQEIVGQQTRWEEDRAKEGSKEYHHSKRDKEKD